MPNQSVEKLIVFTYETDEIQKLEIIFKNDSYELNDKKNKFQVFKLPEWFNDIDNGNYKNKFVFYFYLKLDWNRTKYFYNLFIYSFMI